MYLLLMVDIIKCYCGSQQMDAVLIVESFYKCDKRMLAIVKH